jgi:hypothetical protein
MYFLRGLCLITPVGYKHRHDLATNSIVLAKNKYFHGHNSGELFCCYGQVFWPFTFRNALHFTKVVGHCHYVMRNLLFEIYYFFCVAKYWINSYLNGVIYMTRNCFDKFNISSGACRINQLITVKRV